MTARSVYARIARTYAQRRRELLSLAVMVFIPLGLVHALIEQADGGLPQVTGVGVGALAAAVAVLSGIGLLVSLGLVGFVVPGILVFVYLGRSAPLVEIQGLGMRQSVRRSPELVRGRFLLALAVLLPVEIVGDVLADLATAGLHRALGDSLLVAWLADLAANVALTPFYAVAALVLTREPIAEGPAVARAQPLESPT